MVAESNVSPAVPAPAHLEHALSSMNAAQTDNKKQPFCGLGSLFQCFHQSKNTKEPDDVEGKALDKYEFNAKQGIKSSTQKDMSESNPTQLSQEFDTAHGTGKVSRSGIKLSNQYRVADSGTADIASQEVPTQQHVGQVGLDTNNSGPEADVAPIYNESVSSELQDAGSVHDTIEDSLANESHGGISNAAEYSYSSRRTSRNSMDTNTNAPLKASTLRSLGEPHKQPHANVSKSQLNAPPSTHSAASREIDEDTSAHHGGVYVQDSAASLQHGDPRGLSAHTDFHHQQEERQPQLVQSARYHVDPKESGFRGILTTMDRVHDYALPVHGRSASRDALKRWQTGLRSYNSTRAPPANVAWNYTQRTAKDSLLTPKPSTWRTIPDPTPQYIQTLRSEPANNLTWTPTQNTGTTVATTPWAARPTQSFAQRTLGRSSSPPNFKDMLRRGGPASHRRSTSRRTSGASMDYSGNFTMHGSVHRRSATYNQPVGSNGSMPPGARASLYTVTPSASVDQQKGQSDGVGVGGMKGSDGHPQTGPGTSYGHRMAAEGPLKPVHSQGQVRFVDIVE